MSSLSRLVGMVRPYPALRKPISASFFSTATPKRPLPSNFFRQPPSSLVSRLRQTRSHSGGFGPVRQYAANMAVIKGLIGVNLAVFGYGLYVTAQAKQGYPENAMKFYRNMTMNLADFKNGYYWQAITSIFTHANFFHVGGNLLTFWFLGQFLATAPSITPGRFMLVVFGSGLTGSLVWLLGQQQKLQASGTGINRRGLGFSGAVMGVTTVAACLQPRAQVALYGIIPVPLGLLTLGYALYDGYYINSENSKVAHAGHLGGIAFGLVYYFLKLRGLRIPGSI